MSAFVFNERDKIPQSLGSVWFPVLDFSMIFRMRPVRLPGWGSLCSSHRMVGDIVWHRWKREAVLFLHSKSLPINVAVFTYLLDTILGLFDLWISGPYCEVATKTGKPVHSYWFAKTKVKWTELTVAQLSTKILFIWGSSITLAYFKTRCGFCWACCSVAPNYCFCKKTTFSFGIEA